jgi:Glycosyl transferases group 1
MEQIKQLNLGAYVETVGWVEDVLQFAARAWAFVLPSDEEGFAQVLTEAMSTGCPVIATDALGGGPRFVTDDGTYGLLVPRGDRRRLVEAMEHMLQPEVRARYSALGQQRTAALSPAACATALIEFLSGRFALDTSHCPPVRGSGPADGDDQGKNAKNAPELTDGGGDAAAPGVTFTSTQRVSPWSSSSDVPGNAKPPS